MSDLIINLHTAARHYCIDRLRYVESRCAERTRRRARYVLRRIELLQDVLVEIERFSPRDFRSLQEARDLIKLAATTTKGYLTPDDTAGKRAEERERRGFVRYINRTKDRHLGRIDPLPFRRVLGRIEGEQIHNRLKKKWGTDGFAWYAPTDSRNSNIELFTDKHFQEEVGAERIRVILAEAGITRLWELRRCGPSYELDVELLDLEYFGSEAYWFGRCGRPEAYWFTNVMDWIIYLDEEGVITIGGWLLDEVKRIWSNWKRRTAPRWNPDDWNKLK